MLIHCYRHIVLERATLLFTASIRKYIIISHLTYYYFESRRVAIGRVGRLTKVTNARRYNSTIKT